MKIRIYSDLHNYKLMGRVYDIPVLEHDKQSVLILAGDIDSHQQAINFAESMADRFAHVIFVAGNHEYYGGVLGEHINSSLSNVHILQNKSIEIDGVLFIGSTLWTDFNQRSYSSMHYSRTMMADYSHIKNADGRLITTEHTYNENEFSRRQIDRLIPESTTKKVCVVTHHSPTDDYQNLHPHFRGGILQYAFHNTNMQYLFEYVDLWVHGHTHYNVDYVYPNTNCRIYSNQLGYRNENLPVSIKHEYVVL